MTPWFLILPATVAAFLFVTVTILPRLFIHDKCSVTETKDRGIKKYTDGDDESCLFEPVGAARRAIKQYVLSCRGGQKSLVCKLASAFYYIDFDIVVFNKLGSVCDILNIKESIRDKAYTGVIELPSDAAFVSLNVNCVDDVQYDSKIFTRVSPIKIVLFSALCTILTGLTVAVISVPCAYIFGGIFAERILYDDVSRLVIFVVALAAMLIDFILNLVLISVRNGRNTKRKGSGE